MRICDGGTAVCIPAAGAGGLRDSPLCLHSVAFAWRFCVAKHFAAWPLQRLDLQWDSSGVPFIRWSFISLRWMLQVRVCRSQQQYRTIQNADRLWMFRDGKGGTGRPGISQTLLYLPQTAMNLQPGDRLQAEANCCCPQRDIPTPWTAFITNAEGVFLIASASSYEVLPDSGTTWRNLPIIWNHRLQQQIAKIVPEDASGLITALLTGERSGLTMQQKNDMKRAGIYHTVAVSGMHVSILLGIVLFLTRRKRMLSALIGIPVVLLFILFIGGTPSVTRAGILYILFLLAPLLRREPDPPTSLAAALLFLLLLNRGRWPISAYSFRSPLWRGSCCLAAGSVIGHNRCGRRKPRPIWGIPVTAL